MDKVLVVCAHPDDEVLGVGGTLLKHVKNGDEVYTLILGDGETSRDNNNIAKRNNQAQQVADFAGFKKLFTENLADNKFDSIALLDIVKKIEKVINEVKPTIIYTHFSNDLNVDHQITFKAILTACRPQPNFSVKKILTFETLSSTEWQKKERNNVFCPTVYNDIKNFIENKKKMLEIYQDEIREYPHPRSIQGVEILAKFRGLEVGLEYAEAFEAIRIINE